MGENTSLEEEMLRQAIEASKNEAGGTGTGAGGSGSGALPLDVEDEEEETSITAIDDSKSSVGRGGERTGPNPAYSSAGGRSETKSPPFSSSSSSLSSSSSSTSTLQATAPAPERLPTPIKEHPCKKCGAKFNDFMDLVDHEMEEHS